MTTNAKHVLLVVSAFLVASVALAQSARAQNADPFAHSNEAALTAGAVVAVPGDDAAAWYNPAGLGAISRARLTANGSVFGVRVRPVARGLTSTVRGAQSTLDFGGADFVSTPTTATATFTVMPRLTISGGVFHTDYDVRAASALDEVRTSDGRTLVQRFDSLDHLRRMHAGGAYGFDVGHGVRIGGAMFLVYSARTTSVDFVSGTTSAAATRPDVGVTSISLSGAAFGLQPSYGVQWDVSPRLHLGAMFRFPEVQLTSSRKLSTTEVLTDVSTTTLTVDEARSSSRRIRYAAPARVFAGVAYDATSRTRLSLDADVSLSLDEDTWGQAHRAQLRARAGVLTRASDAIYVGAGAFADPSSQRALSRTIGAIRADYYGGTAGMIVRSRLGSDTSSAVVTLSVAVRYAIGVGEARTVAVGDAGETLGTSDVVVHDVMPYVGSSVAF